MNMIDRFQPNNISFDIENEIGALGHALVASVLSALNEAGTAAIAIDSSGVVLNVNEKASGIFDDDVFIKNYRLFVCDQRGAASFNRLLERFMTTLNPTSYRPNACAIRRWGKTPLIVEIVPLRPIACGPWLGLLILKSALMRRSSSSSIIAEAFELTPAEARLAAALARGLSLKNAATEFGITRQTARNQLKSVFAKTGTHRQGELVALLAAI